MGPGVQTPRDHLVNVLGSGTDYTPFYQHLGIVSANLGFNIEHTTYGVYHSTMDTLRYMDLYGDPTYASHVLTAQWWGLMSLRLADAEVLPFDYRTYALVLHRYIDEFEGEMQRRGHEGVDFTGLRDASTHFLERAEAFYGRLSTLKKTKGTLRDVNDRLMYTERQFLLKDGLQHRNWFKHALFGPGYYTGYGAVAFPGLADALSLHDSPEEFQRQLDLLDGAINKAADYLMLE
jgi:N-acetylated-alpha-linked acidic dipeptidase